MSYSKTIQIFEKAFGKGEFSRDKENYQVTCPSCSKIKRTTKRKLHIKVDDLRYHCWVCGMKGKNILSLIKKIRPDLVDIKISHHHKPKKEEEKQEISLPQGLVFVSDKSRDPDIKAVRNYLLSRGVSVQKMKRWRMMTSKEGSLRRHVVIPSFNSEGDLNYYVGRAIDKTEFRYRNAKKRKSEVIFNEIDIDWSKAVILVEGIFDAIKCPENAIPILGSSISKKSELFKKLTKFQPSVVVAMDPDMPEKAYQIAENLSTTGCKTYVAFAPAGKDLGDMSYVTARDIISNKVEYNSYMKIKQKIGALRSGSIF